jgi:hypothetical protein
MTGFILDRTANDLVSSIDCIFDLMTLNRWDSILPDVESDFHTPQMSIELATTYRLSCMCKVLNESTHTVNVSSHSCAHMASCHVSAT